MEELNFDFVKSRDIGALIQDFMGLFKQIWKHFHKSILSFILPALAIFLILFFLATSYGVNVYYVDQWDSPLSVILMIFVGILLLMAYFLFIPTFAFEYIFLLQEKGDFSFTGGEVWEGILRNFRKYMLFFLSSIVVGMIILIPVSIVFAILMFIPVVGSIALGIFTSCLSVVFICALLLYRKDREKLADSYLAAVKLLKKKILSYGLAAYVFRFLLGICLSLLMIIPILLLGLIGYNTVGFNTDFFMTFTGKILTSIGGSILMIVATFSTLYGVIFVMLIYFSSLEEAKQEGTLSQIERIGKSDMTS